MATANIATTRRATKPGHIAIRTRFLSVQLNIRVLLYTLIAALVLGILAIWAMTLGSYHIPFAGVARAVVGDGSPDQEFIVRTLRLPRVISAILIGACLAMSGAVFQGLVRNALVSPDIIGIETGATLFAVFWIVTGQTSTLLPIAAFIGAALAAVAVYLLSWKGGISANRLILVGIGASATLSAGTTFLTVRYPVDVVMPAIAWSVGSIYGSDWWDVKVLLAATALLAPIAVVLTWPLRTLQLGDDVSRGLGLPLERTRLGLIAVGCGLCAVAVSIAGPIGFVALMVPHAARMLAGPLSGSVILFTGVLGACFLLLADVIAQHFLPVSLPVGVVTSAVGAPYFLFLLYRFNVRM
jgi:iron complex transport system permease protein